MATTSKSFTATGAGPTLGLKPGDSVAYSVSGTFVGTVVVERSADGGNTWTTLATATAAATGTLIHTGVKLWLVRFRCSAFTSGTIVTAVTDVLVGKKLSISAAGKAKVGATAGWVVAAASDVALVTLPASQTASTLVIPLHSLTVGQRITGFSLVGQVESAGGAVTLDASLRKQTAAAADVADSLVGSMTQLALAADAILSSSNAGLRGLDEVVAEDATYYLLVTGTTAASTDVALQGAIINLKES